MHASISKRASSLLIAAICLLPHQANAAPKPKLVQKRCAAIQSGTQLTVALKRPVRAASLIVAYVAWDGASETVVSDSAGSDYRSAVGPTLSGASRAQIFYASGVSAGSIAVTSSFDGGVASRGVLCAHEYSGLDATEPLRAAAAASGSSGAIESRAVPASAGDVLFLGAQTDGMSVQKLRSHWKSRIAKYGVRTADRLVTSAGAYDATAVQKGSSAWTVQIAAFRPAPGLEPNPKLPLGVSPNRRYLVDRKNVPFLLTGDSPQALFVALSEAEADAFFANRRAAGFNALWLNLLAASSMGGRDDASTFDGIPPFETPGDLSTPNEAYFARADRILKLAAQHGLVVFLDPAETIDFLQVLRANGVDKARRYGRFLGARYERYDNIVWMSGNDFQTWSNPDDDAVVQAVARGIRDRDRRHLHTAHLSFLVSSTRDDPSWETLIDLDAVYTYLPTYAKVLSEYARSKPMPIVLTEANYEFEGNAYDRYTPQILRRQAYWTLLSGGAGHFYGNSYTWPFRSDWQSNLDTPGSRQMGLVKSVFEPRAWYDLVPDAAHEVVTSGSGIPIECCALLDSDYLTAARTPDGALVMAYMPTAREIAVDMSKLAAPAHAAWYDPSDGRYTPIEGSPFANSGSRSFSPPGPDADGDGDWLLILETKALVPGS